MAPKKLQPHHDAWLSAHPGRTEEWLRQMFIEGFDIHHVDGDHGNNTPLNLVLIEAVDHMRLHGFRLPNGLSGWRKRLQEKSTIAKRASGKAVSIPKEEAPPRALTRSRKIVVNYAARPESELAPYQGAPVHSGLNEMDVRAYLSRAG